MNEAQKKIVEIYRAFHGGREPHQSFPTEILRHLRELGYRKPSNRPELRKKIKDILDYETSLCQNPTEVGKEDCGHETDSAACGDCQLEQILDLIPELPESKGGAIWTKEVRYGKG